MSYSAEDFGYTFLTNIEDSDGPSNSKSNKKVKPTNTSTTSTGEIVVAIPNLNVNDPNSSDTSSPENTNLTNEVDINSLGLPPVTPKPAAANALQKEPSFGNNDNENPEARFVFAPGELDFDFMSVGNGKGKKGKTMGKSTGPDVPGPGPAFFFGQGSSDDTSTGGDDSPPPAAVGTATCCVCCCCLVIFSLVPGGILYVIANNDELRFENEDTNKKVVLSGVILMFLSLFFCMCAFLCCCTSCITGRMTGSSDEESGSGLGLFGGVFGKSAGGDEGQDEFEFTFKRLNGKYEKERDKLKNVRLDIGANLKLPELKRQETSVNTEKKRLEKIKKKEMENEIKFELNNKLTPEMIVRKLRPCCFKIVFDGDMQVSGIDLLREQITLIIKVATRGTDIVAFVISSPGGSAIMYGLAASQLVRIKNAGLKLIVCVDSVAASGGYMMASVADEIYAAPFALVGSIGVISIVPNIEKLLKEHKIETYVLTSGKYKNTVNVVGDVTEEGKQKFLEEMEKIHQAFKDHIVLNRPQLKDSIEDIATGEAFLAIEAKKYGLVDHISTSDEFLLSLSDKYEIILVKKKNKNKLGFDFGNMTKKMLANFTVSNAATAITDSLQQNKGYTQLRDTRDINL